MNKDVNKLLLDSKTLLSSGCNHFVVMFVDRQVCDDKTAAAIEL